MEMENESELEAKIKQLESPEGQGDPLSVWMFVKMVILALVIPAVLLIIGGCLL